MLMKSTITGTIISTLHQLFATCGITKDVEHRSINQISSTTLRTLVMVSLHPTLIPHPNAMVGVRKLLTTSCATHGGDTGGDAGGEFDSLRFRTMPQLVFKNPTEINLDACDLSSPQNAQTSETGAIIGHTVTSNVVEILVENS
ncbi:hypothetical protein ACTXT7_017459, partial [Hymenolepis weldensis]